MPISRKTANTPSPPVSTSPTQRTSRLRAWLFDCASGVTILTLPLTVFLKHNDYSLLRPESLICLGLAILAGILSGTLMTIGRNPWRLVMTICLLVLLVDIQTTWITTWGTRLLLVTLFFTGLTWLLRRRLSQAVTLICGAMLLTTLILPGEATVWRVGHPGGHPTTHPDAATPIRENLPFLLHIILDEYIGIEGIPREFDPEGRLAESIRDRYLADSFEVYGRAYSRYVDTHESVPNMLNFTASDQPYLYCRPRFARGDLVRKNAWFDYLRRIGYRIHVVQTNYIMLSHPEPPDAEEEERLGDSCLTYTAETIKSLESEPLSPPEKAHFMMGSYYRLSFFLTLHRTWYGQLRQSRLGQAIGLPPWDQTGNRLSTLAALQIMDRLEEELAWAGPGQAFVVHLLLPHSPFSYDSECGIRPMDGWWLRARDMDKAPRRNDTDSRAIRYPLYLNQLQCTNRRLQDLFQILKDRGLWDDTIVILHGDHGSRISRSSLKFAHLDQVVPEDYLDAFSTLFAVKRPGVPGRYDRRILPLDYLLPEVFGIAGEEVGRELEANPSVFLTDERRTMRPHPLPPFAYGEPLPQ